MSINSLFNPSFLKKKLTEYKNIDSDKIKNAREIFERWNTSVDLTKEKENQQSFLKEFFEEILGYQGVAGKKDNSLWWESGSQVDGKKPDGIMGFNLASYKAETVSMKDAGDVRVVIELKDCTVNLDKNQKRKEFHGTPIEQGFSYASKVGSSCEFVIISNFKQIRLYKYGQGGGEGKYHEFLLDDLANSDEKIKEFHFLLSKDQLFRKVSNQSPVHSLDMTDRGEEIEKRFYKHYSTLREEIWHNLTELNQEKHYGRNFYLYKAQKLIDRIVFIRFCRENGALDNDAVLEALSNKFVPGKYNRLKFLFQAMDGGNPEIGIAKFNGGLFATDTDLDCLNISDEIIDKIVGRKQDGCLMDGIYHYDFGSDLTVNILGHIFEQSISDLESLTGDNEKKRKKDGVFYTPAYITEYIVREAIGGWLNDRKAEIKAKEGSKEFWQEYAAKLKTIKILDPACGSGAFLVKVFDYLQNEWREVQNHVKTEWSYKDILTHNIYGVDINPASTGITKLSLWLKTAHYREPLTTLDGNIKIGNSLIDNPDIAGYYSEFEGKVIQEVVTRDLLTHQELDKLTAEGVKKSLAFKWNEEFKEVFDAGGFDVVVGNPPYGADLGENSQKYLTSKYTTAFYKIDSYAIFMEQAINIANKQAFIGMITPYTWLTINQHYKLRQKIIELGLRKIVDLPIKVFEAADLDTIIAIFCKNIPNNLIELYNIQDDNRILFYKNIDVAKIDTQTYAINVKVSNIDFDLIAKIKNISIPLGECGEFEVSQGLIPYDKYRGHDEDTIKNRVYHANYAKDATYKPELQGSDISRYSIEWNGQTYISYGNWLAAPRKQSFFVEPRVLIMEVTRGDYYKIKATYTDKEYYNTPSIINIIGKNGNTNLSFLLSLLNSRLYTWWHVKTNSKANAQTSIPKILVGDIRNLPIPQIHLTEQTPFITHAQKMLDLTRELNEKRTAFVDYFRGKFALQKITRNLESWHTFEFADFIKELAKQKVKFSSTDEFDFKPLFDREKKVCVELQAKITQTDAEIDKMVYALYGLSEEEIGVVENLVE